MWTTTRYEGRVVTGAPAWPRGARSSWIAESSRARRPRRVRQLRRRTAARLSVIVVRTVVRPTAVGSRAVQTAAMPQTVSAWPSTGMAPAAGDQAELVSIRPILNCRMRTGAHDDRAADVVDLPCRLALGRSLRLHPHLHARGGSRRGRHELEAAIVTIMLGNLIVCVPMVLVRTRGRATGSRSPSSPEPRSASTDRTCRR